MTALLVAGNHRHIDGDDKIKLFFESVQSHQDDLILNKFYSKTDVARHATRGRYPWTSAVRAFPLKQLKYFFDLTLQRLNFLVAIQVDQLF